jgi:hypothetical protein
VQSPEFKPQSHPKRRRRRRRRRNFAIPTQKLEIYTFTTISILRIYPEDTFQQYKKTCTRLVITVFFKFSFVFQTGYHYVTQAGLELVILLHPSHKD